MSNIWDYTFNNIVIPNYNDPSAPSAVLSGTVEVNYDAATVSANDHGATGVTFTVQGSPETFVDFHVIKVLYNPTTGYSTAYFAYPAGGGVDGGNIWLYGTSTSYTNNIYYQAGSTQYLNRDNNSITAVHVCYASGTRIRTPHGDVPVQALRAGDTVLTASGEPRRIKWTGRRRMRRAFDGRKHDTVRIAAHAFGENRPARDLVVSPTHSICVDILGEVLIPAARLVNGATITLEAVDRVAWHHVELDSHDILLADNLPAESYLDMGNCEFFEEAGATRDTLERDAVPSHADFCRPFVDTGRTLEFVRERLLDRARAFGWRPRRDADLRLVADGATVFPTTRPRRATFVLPAGAADVRLVSNTYTPASLGSIDKRRLGASITELVFSTVSGETRVIGAADARLRDGAHAVEGSGALSWRWTDGELVLDPALWAGLSGPLILTVDWDDAVVRGWVAPVAADERVAA